MKGLRLLNNGEWNKPPVLLAARRIIINALGEYCCHCTLGDAALFLNGTSYDVAQVNEFATAPIIRISNITDPSSPYLRTGEPLDRKFWVTPGDLLVSWSASFKSIIWAGLPGYLNQHIFKVTERLGFDRRYIRHAIEASFDEMQENVVGIGMMHLRRGDFLGQRIPAPPVTTQKAVADYLDFIESGGKGKPPTLPQTLAKQHRLVARIKELADRLQEARILRYQATKQAEALRVSALAQALSSSAGDESVHLPMLRQEVRRGVEAPTVVNEAAANWSVPTGWVRISVAELLLCGALLDVKDGNHGSNHPRSSEFIGEGTPFLMASDIQDGSVCWAEASRLGKETLSRLRVGFSRAADVLFTHKASIGRTAIADRDCVLSPQVTYYRCNSEFIEPRWLQSFLSSPLFLSQLTDIQAQSTRDFVSISKQYQQFVLLPPIRAQRRIVSELDALRAEMDSLKCLQAETATELDALLPSVLSKAFAGDLLID